MTSKITFLNQPKLSEFEIQKNFNEKRLGLIPLIEDLLSHNLLLKHNSVNVTFIEKGVGSLVSIVEASDKKMVLKIPLSMTTSQGEVMFLKVWEQSGVKVPRIIEEGLIGDFSYILMEYVEAPVLSDILNKNKKTEWSSFELGRILRKMHIPKANGYGRVVDGKPEFQTFEEWLGDKKIRKGIEYIKNNNLFPIDDLKITKIISILTEHVKNNQSSYCHFDFGNSNIFATIPVTVFDPNPQFNNGYLDLGLSVFNCITSGVDPKGLIDGYFEHETCNERVLFASVVLNCFVKLPSRHKKEKFEDIKNIQQYITERIHTLL